MRFRRVWGEFSHSLFLQTSIPGSVRDGSAKATLDVAKSLAKKWFRMRPLGLPLESELSQASEMSFC